MSEPSNVVYLAAELASAGAGSTRAAKAAVELCKLGRRYRRLSERLCGGEEEWEPWDDRVARLQEQAQALLFRLHRKAMRIAFEAAGDNSKILNEGLLLKAETVANGIKLVTALL